MNLYGDVKPINGYNYIQYTPEVLTTDEMLAGAAQIAEYMDQRRTVRDFCDRDVPKQVIENIIKAASTAPSGAHKQPWTFCVVSNPELKKQIRAAAEKEEYDSYHGRMTDEWLKDLEPLGTDWNKPFLETAPWLIIVFKRIFEFEEDGRKHNNYYVSESVGIACGFLLHAIQRAGLVALTHTPSPMNFLQKLLNRPDNERPYLLVPVGYAADEVWVPHIHRKPLDEVAAFYE
jgi:iodotyrosine deiodinase